MGRGLALPLQCWAAMRAHLRVRGDQLLLGLRAALGMLQRGRLAWQYVACAGGASSRVSWSG